MYISKIDDLIDNVIDDFYANVVIKDKQLTQIFKESNFVRFQQDINKIVKEYIQTVNFKYLKSLVKNNEAINTIFEVIKRYIMFYLFLTIGYHYQHKSDTYINNIVEFTKNQPEYDFKIENFFNSESNSLIIKYNDFVRNILTLLDADKSKIEILKKKPDFKEVILFLNELGGEYINKNFKLDSSEIKKNKNLQCHNIIKTIIILLLYKTNEKKEIFRLLEMTEHVNDEYMFIDIVVPKQQYVDYSSIEKIVGANSSVKNLANYFWKFIQEYEKNLNLPPKTPDEKINILIQSGLLTPICDDFLLYHKESEKYDRAVDPNKIKKKEDTKIRYIINKIDNVSDYFSNQVKTNEKAKENVKKNFYVPLLSQKAILINDYEDVNIINKFINQGKRSIENNEYFNDLLHYKSYPYVNFKDFETSGFSMALTETVNAVRRVTVESSGDFRQRNKNNFLQLRVGSKDMIVNIVGFMIGTNKKPIQCIKNKEILDIRSLSEKTENGYDLMLNFLKQSLLETVEHKSSVFWMFDLEKDSKIKNSDNMSKSEISDHIKHMMAMLYDEILNELYYVISDELEKHEKLNIQMAHKIISMMEKKIINVPHNSELSHKIDEKIYELIEKTSDEYDKNEDVLHGMHGKIIELPKYDINSRKRNAQVVNINISGISEYGTIEKELQVEGVCQHNITWDKISSMHKKNPKLYIDQLYLFIQQYVIENVHQEYVCKSCGTQLNIKKYILDGAFDDSTQKFITYSMPMDISLEEIPEYEKFKITIRNIDKLIEKLAVVSNIPNLVKSSTGVKWKRKAIVKDTIDVILSNNNKLKRTFKERNENATKLYGINRDLSSLFIFELENSIFVFSSKDKDHYKPIKQNNIMAYLIYLISLEISDSHISFIGDDKKGLCNVHIFDKIYKSLFGDLKIRINNNGDLAPITNYKILCYIIYVLGCSSIRYNMWHYESKDTANKKKHNPIIQKILVHTVVDIINSILEIASLNTQSQLYEVLSVKMFRKLTTTFSNDDLYNKLKTEGRVSIHEQKLHTSTADVKFVDLTGKYKPMEYAPPYRATCRTSKLILQKRKNLHSKYYSVNNITNCKDGDFHTWKPNNGNFICLSCNKQANEIKHDKSVSDKILDNFKVVRLTKLSEKLCYIDGTFHNFVNIDNVKTCTKCKNVIDHKYTLDELNKLDTSIGNRDQSKNKEIAKQKEKLNDDNNKELSYIDKVVKTVTTAYEENSNFKYIYLLLDEIKAEIGNDINSVGSLYDDSYIITHDHLGIQLDNEISITDNKKIYFKENHPFFKTDVLYYSSHKAGKIDIFYNATTKILLGYKEESKNFTHNKKQDVKLIINYSLLNKLKLLGYSSQYVDITPEYEHELEETENLNIDTELINTNIVSNIMRNRMANLKKVIYEFQRILYRLLNNYNQPINNEDELDYFSNIMNSFLTKYKKKFNDITLTDKNREHGVFKHWKGVYRGIFSEQISNTLFNFETHKIVNVTDISKIDTNGNIVLFYIVKELTKLLQYNTNKMIKASLIYFIVDFINTIFLFFNTEKLTNNINIKRFYYLLNSYTYVNEVSEKSGIKNVEGIYSEYADDAQEVSQETKEQTEDVEAEQEGLDIESEYQNEDGFERAQEWEPAGEIIYNPAYQIAQFN